MSTELLEVYPQELKFVFELKKQSSCSIQLISNSDQYVAFKVKTTSPKKYCVRPNAGIIKPYATCDFTVTMQAQHEAPPDMHCKDKFLVQSTVVPFGTTEEEITSDMFAKNSGKYIEDKKLKVVLISPPISPVLLPSNGTFKHDSYYEAPMQKEKVLTGVENIPPPDKVDNDVGLKTAKDMNEFNMAKDVEFNSPTEAVELRTAKVEDFKNAKDVEFKTAKDMEELKTIKDVEPRPNRNTNDLKLAKDFEELTSKLNVLEAKLSEAGSTIKKLTEESRAVAEEKEALVQELAALRQKSRVRKVQVGFPLLFVCMVALISAALGYLVHP